MSGRGLLLACEYCGWQGNYGEGIEIRNGKFVCADTVRCDEREAAQAEHEEEQ